MTSIFWKVNPPPPPKQGQFPIKPGGHLGSRDEFVDVVFVGENFHRIPRVGFMTLRAFFFVLGFVLLVFFF